MASATKKTPEVINLVHPTNMDAVAETPSTQDPIQMIGQLIPQTLLEMLVNSVREKVRTEELGAINQSLLQLNENLNQNILQNATTAVALAPTTPPAVVEDDDENWVKLAEDEFVITEMEANFIRVHAAIARSVMQRMPIMRGIRSDVDPKGNPHLVVNYSDGIYGVEYHMRTVHLTLQIEDFQLEGFYWDSTAAEGRGRNIDLTEDQLNRIMDALVFRMKSALEAQEDRGD